MLQNYYDICNLKVVNTSDFIKLVRMHDNSKEINDIISKNIKLF